MSRLEIKQAKATCIAGTPAQWALLSAKPGIDVVFPHGCTNPHGKAIYQASGSRFRCYSLNSADNIVPVDSVQAENDVAAMEMTGQLVLVKHAKFTAMRGASVSAEPDAQAAIPKQGDLGNQ